MDYEKKLADLGKMYEKKKQDAAKRKGALLQTLENLKTEHGVETAEDAKNLINELQAKLDKWETERDTLMNQITAGLAGEVPAEASPLAEHMTDTTGRDTGDDDIEDEDGFGIESDDDFDDDDFDDFED